MCTYSLCTSGCQSMGGRSAAAVPCLTMLSCLAEVLPLVSSISDMTFANVVWQSICDTQPEHSFES